MVFGFLRKLKAGRHNTQPIERAIKEPAVSEQIQKEMSEEIKSLEKKDANA